MACCTKKAPLSKDTSSYITLLLSPASFLPSSAALWALLILAWPSMKRSTKPWSSELASIFSMSAPHNGQSLNLDTQTLEPPKTQFNWRQGNGISENKVWFFWHLLAEGMRTGDAFGRVEEKGVAYHAAERAKLEALGIITQGAFWGNRRRLRRRRLFLDRLWWSRGFHERAHRSHLLLPILQISWASGYDDVWILLAASIVLGVWTLDCVINDYPPPSLSWDFEFNNQ